MARARNEENSMESTTGKTGIVIHAGITEGARTIGKLLNAVHLGRLAVHLVGHSVMVIVVDGVEHREPFYEAHFVACAPGEHALSIHHRQEGLLPGPDALQRLFTSKTLRLTVPTDGVVHVIYTPGGMGQVALELGGNP
jgi:hypothetical protein